MRLTNNNVSFHDTIKHAHTLGVGEILNKRWLDREEPLSFEQLCEELNVPLVYQNSEVPKPPKVEKVSELIIDAYYFLLRKIPDGHGDREVLIQQCKVASSYTVKENGEEHRVPDRSTMFFYNHFWATESHNTAMEVFDIYGPIEIPDFN